MTKPAIGWIGTGIMGRPMALNLLNAGYAITTYARRPESLQPLVEAGATTRDQPGEVAAATDLTILCVSDTPDVQALITGKNGILSGAREGHIVVDMSTISPITTRELAKQLQQHGIEMLDAPVSGGETGAIAGTLSIMVGGPEETFKRVLPIFEVLGGQVLRIGDVGAGQVAKACNQMLVAQTMEGIAEAFLLAQAHGVDCWRVRDALLGGFGRSRALEVHGERMLKQDYQPGFKARLHLKDLRNIEKDVQQLNLHLSSLEDVLELMCDLVEQGDGELDSAAIAKVVHSRTLR